MPSADDLRYRAEQLRRSLPPRYQATPPADEGQRLATLSRSPTEELRVSWNIFQGHADRPFVNLRIWNRDAQGQWFPDSRKGLSVRLRELPEFAQAIAAALDLAVASTSRPTPPMPGRLPPPSPPPPWSTATLPASEPPADGATFSEFAESES